MRKREHLPQLTALSLAMTTALAAVVPTAAKADQTISGPTSSQVNWTTGNVTITNSGLVSVSTTAVSVGGSVGTLTNSGTISAGTGYAGISNFGESVTAINNIGTIGGGDYGISNVNGTINSLTNSGTISGINGIFNYNGTIGTLTNSGLITGSVAAIYNRSSGLLGTLINSGTIAGNVFNASSHNLTINGGTGSTFGTLTGVSGGIGSGAIGTLTNTAANLFFGSGNQLLNDNINVGSSHTVTNSAATLQINNAISITGNYSQSTAATLKIGVGDSAVTSTGTTSDTGYGRLTVSGNATIAAGSTVALTKLGSYGFAQGQRYVVVVASGSSTNYNAGSLVYTAAGFSGTVTGESVTDGSKLDLLLTLSSPPSLPNSPSPPDPSGSGSSSPINLATTSNAVSSLNGLFNYGGVNAGLLNLFNASAAIGSAAEADRAGAQLSPTANAAAATQAATAPTEAVLNATAAHVDGLRTAQVQGHSGVSAGESANSPAVWGQAFGGQVNQRQRDGVSGHRGDYNGLLMGVDTPVNDSWRAGGLLSYANTSVAGRDNNTGSAVHLTSHGLIGYAAYTGNPWYVDMSAGVVQHRYNTVRAINFTGFSDSVAGQYHGMQYVTSVRAGYPIKLGAAMYDMTLTPIAGLAYSRLHQNAYTETGGSAAALHVDATDTTSLKSDLGAKLERSLATAYGEVRSSVQLGWRHELRNRSLQSVANYAADTSGATSFTTTGATTPANTGVLALGVSLLRNENLTLSARYTVEAAGGYSAQTVDLRLRYQF